MTSGLRTFVPPDFYIGMALFIQGLAGDWGEMLMSLTNLNPRAPVVLNLRFGGTEVGARRVQIPNRRRFDWSSRAKHLAKHFPSWEATVFNDLISGLEIPRLGRGINTKGPTGSTLRHFPKTHRNTVQLLGFIV